MPRHNVVPPIEDEDRNPAVHARDGPEQVVELSLTELYPCKNHPFHVVDDVHIAGVQFDVFQGDTLVGTMTTNAQGIAIIEDLEKGTYTVKEHALPTGYVGELTEMTAVVVSDQITELPATNTPSRSKVRIVKTDALSGAVLPGAEFTIQMARILMHTFC